MLYDRDKPFVSVVVPTYNRKDSLKYCIESLLNQSYPEYELLIINDGSTDGTKQLLEQHSSENPNLRFFTQSNQGPGAARNLGIKNCKGEIICFTDDDCIADKNWIKHISLGYTNESIDGVGGNIIDYRIETTIEKYIKERRLLNQEMFFDPIVTANTSYHKMAIKKVGFFDESLMACEDVDFGIRVRLKGFRIKYNSNAVIYHKHRATLKGLIKQQYNYGKSNARLHKKYTKDFYPSYNLTLIPLKIIHRIITYPLRILKTPFVKDKKYYLAEPLLDILVFSAHFLGIINEILFGKPYTGEKYTEKLEFIGEQSISKLLKRMWSKITI